MRFCPIVVLLYMPFVHRSFSPVHGVLVHVIDRCVAFVCHASFPPFHPSLLSFCYCYSGGDVVMRFDDFFYPFRFRECCCFGFFFSARCVFDGRKKLLHKYREHTKLIIILSEFGRTNNFERKKMGCRKFQKYRKRKLLLSRETAATKQQQLPATRHR